MYVMSRKCDDKSPTADVRKRLGGLDRRLTLVSTNRGKNLIYQKRQIYNLFTVGKSTPAFPYSAEGLG